MTYASGLALSPNAKPIKPPRNAPPGPNIAPTPAPNVAPATLFSVFALSYLDRLRGARLIPFHFLTVREVVVDFSRLQGMQSSDSASSHTSDRYRDLDGRGRGSRPMNDAFGRSWPLPYRFELPMQYAQLS